VSKFVRPLQAYGTHDFKRFVYTWSLSRDIKGRCLELGANPYFTTMLLERYTSLELSLANYFGFSDNRIYSQSVSFKDIEHNKDCNITFDYEHFNIEEDKFPYKDNEFELVIFAEIIEHLLNDPCSVLREIKRVLKPDGYLVLTTPNVARLENVARIIQGSNIYDPYSGYGPYGRHNREYNCHELVKLLEHEGFEIEVCFTSDVHVNNSSEYLDLNKVVDMLKTREKDLGQYIFIRAKNTGNVATKKPSWLYRSLPAEQLD
jgi:SAM-dependent methyltransferase